MFSSATSLTSFPADDNMLEVEEGEDEGPQVIEIASDSEDGSEEEKEGQC